MSDVPHPPWRKKSTTKRAQKSERQGAKLEGARLTPMSGAGRIKGDFQTDRWLVEDRTTEAASYRVEQSTLVRTLRQAVTSRRLPQWRVTINEGRSGELTVRLLMEKDYLALMERLEELERQA